MKPNYVVTAVDIKSDRLDELLIRENVSFRFGDILDDDGWIENLIRESDVVVPLVAIASPMMYVKNPIKVFELDFEANLPIVRLCAKHKKHLVFPSSSEVYGMSPDLEFNPLTTNLVTGPINKQRWIYSTCKQLLDRLIFALGESEGLNYTIFRPFNWFGPGLDSVDTPREGGSRVVTSFIGSLIHGKEIVLVNGGNQRRAFTYIDDGISALESIIANRRSSANRMIFNIGNPTNDYSIAHLASEIIELSLDIPTLRDAASHARIISISEEEFYGEGYQDVLSRNPDISQTTEFLDWTPRYSLRDGLRATLNFYGDAT